MHCPTWLDLVATRLAVTAAWSLAVNTDGNRCFTNQPTTWPSPPGVKRSLAPVMHFEDTLMRIL